MRHPNRSLLRLLALLCALVLVGAACADDEEDAATDTGTAAEQTTTTEGDEATTTTEGEGAALDDEGSERLQARLTADLSGENNVEGGDPDGSGQATFEVDVNREEICYELTVENLGTITGAHIHEGAAGEAGPIVIPLEEPTGGEVSNCVQEIERALVERIVSNPQDYYVNVHTQEFPAGAVRGQLQTSQT